MPSSAKIKFPAEALIRQEVERGGPITVDKFVDLALYHPRYGYYNQTAPRRGREGDYFTSLQVSEIFPQIFAEAIYQMKETLGAEQFSLIEVGSGGGEFLEGVLNHLNRTGRLKGFRVWSVERSRPARDVLWRRLSRFPRTEVIGSIDDIEWMGTVEGCIFSNEFFDALSFHRLRWKGGAWREIRIGLSGETLSEVEADVSPALVSLLPSSASLVDGHEIELRPQIPSILEEWSARLARGYVLTVDYGHPRAAMLDSVRANGTWMGFHKHQAVKDMLSNIGEQDLTAHVDFSQLAEAGVPVGFEPQLFCSQGLFLSHVGQSIIQKFLESATDENRRVRTGMVQQLIHPGAMGEKFWVLLQGKGLPKPASFDEIPNRLRRLAAPVL